MIWHSVSLRAKNINFNYLQLKKFLNLTFSKLLSGRAKNMVKIPPPFYRVLIGHCDERKVNCTISKNIFCPVGEKVVSLLFHKPSEMPWQRLRNS